MKQQGKWQGETGCSVSFTTTLPSSHPFPATRKYTYEDEDNRRYREVEIDEVARRNPFLRRSTVRLIIENGCEDILD